MFSALKIIKIRNPIPINKNSYKKDSSLVKNKIAIKITEQNVLVPNAFKL